jgi:hypothetical protein
MSVPQHHKGRKRPRAWHRGRREERRWLGHLENLETRVKGIEKRLHRG